jgi:lysophospholipase L1-like esterase
LTGRVVGPIFDQLCGQSKQAEKQVKRRYKVVLALAVGTVVGSALVLTAEFILRARERARGTPGTMSMAFYQHSRLRHALIRDLDYFGWARVDSSGFRGTGVSVTKPDGVMRIMAVGGSTTFDAKVAGDSNAWPKRLEYWLNSLAADPPVEVINAGTPGYTVLENLIRLVTELHRYEPDLIILYQTHNDLSAALWQAWQPDHYQRRPDEVRPLTPWTRWLIGRSLFYNGLYGRWRALWDPLERTKPEDEPPPERLHTAIEQGAAKFEREVTLFSAAARELGICVLLPEVSHLRGAGDLRETDPEVMNAWNRTYPTAPVDTVLRGYERYRLAGHNAADSSGAMVLSAVDFGIAGSTYYAPGDAMHFSAAGADRMGHELAQAILADDLLNLTSWCPHAVYPRDRDTNSP